MQDLAFSRVAELEAKLEILQVRFDKIRAVVAVELDRLEGWATDDRARRDTQVDDWDISEARESLRSALSI